jgi:hypothetical protein
MTSREFFETYDLRDLPPLDIAFIDGNHSYEDVRYAFVAAMGSMRKGGFIILQNTKL